MLNNYFVNIEYVVLRGIAGDLLRTGAGAPKQNVNDTSLCIGSTTHRGVDIVKWLVKWLVNVITTIIKHH